MPQRRDHPYIWATWLSRLLTGENSCEWAIWFKAHYVEWTRQPSDFDQAKWLMRHTALLNQQRQGWEDDGCRIFVEAQNAFRLRGKSATLAGRPDLVVLDDRDAIIIDVKTGQERAWHRVQVMIYQYALPLALPQYRNVRIGGEVIYPTHTVRVPRGALSGQFIEELGALIRRLAADAPPRRVPSAQECRYCELTAEDCPARVEEAGPAAVGSTDDF